MPDRKRMSPFGVGPFYILLILILTLGAAYAGKQRIVSAGVFPALELPMRLLGLIFIVLGIVLMIGAVVFSRRRRMATEDKLFTTGVYAWVRNPLYSAYAFIFSGMLFLLNNVFLLAVPLLFWLLLSLIVRREESMLEATFGQEYLRYKARVNRCIPWFPSKT